MTRRQFVMAILFWIGEAALDGFILWLLYTKDHPWWALIYALLCSSCAAKRVVRYLRPDRGAVGQGNVTDVDYEVLPR